jgi:predicted dehydrogenase
MSDSQPVDTLARELDAFVEAISGGAPYPVTRTQALAGVAAMEAIGQSARDGGTWTNVPALPPPAVLDTALTAS